MYCNLIDSHYEGVRGIGVIDSGKTGPIFGISVCTHGGEHAGLRTVEYLVHNLKLHKKLVSGKVFLILTNIRAYQLSLQTQHPADARFIDENLNRCCTEENMLNGQSYEAGRARELEPILAKLDYHLDIHSTYSKSQAIGIVTMRGKEILGKMLNVDVAYENLTQIQVGRPFIDITERYGGIGIGLEAGYELDETGFQIGVENSLRILSGLKMIESELMDDQGYVKKRNTPLFVYSSIVPRGKNFQPTRNFKHAEGVKKGELIGSDDSQQYFAPEDSIILMPSVPEKLRIIVEKGQVEEYCFLGRAL